MTIRTFTTAVCAVAASLIFIAPAAAANGAGLYSAKSCIGCHGESGKKPVMATYPKLAGQNKAYLLQQMKDIKSGARSNGNTALMKPIIGMVTPAEMEAIATYLSGQ